MTRPRGLLQSYVITKKQGDSLHTYSTLVLIALIGFNFFAEAHPFQNLERVAIRKMMENISPADGSPGVVVASPEKLSPPYYFHWQRDAALTMSTVLSLYQRSYEPEKSLYRRRLIEFAEFSRRLQLTPSPVGLSEPKYHVDGRPFTEGWCRPQTDGPALRALVMTRLALVLLKEGQGKYVRSFFYDSQSPTLSLIKTDLEYVSKHWRDKSCDIWEEVEGDHLYMRLVQRRALAEGAELAELLHDPFAASWYRSQSQVIEMTLSDFWSAARGYFIPTINQSGGLNYKDSQVDTAVLLAILHARGQDDFFSATDPRTVQTLRQFELHFRSLYAINQQAGIPGIAIGRYPEDRYAGTDFNGGNPWVLTTAAFAQLNYRLAASAHQEGRTEEALSLRNLGDEYLMRVEYHANVGGSLSEQIQRDTGFMTSARDLTWNYVEVLQAIWARPVF